MTNNNDSYRAIIRPVPSIVGNEIKWGWDVALTDLSTDKKEDFSESGLYDSADEALAAGAVLMRRWMDALQTVKEKEVSQVNLDAALPEPEKAPEPEPESEPEAETKEEAEGTAEEGESSGVSE